MGLFVDGGSASPVDASAIDGIPADLKPAGSGQDGYVVTYVNANGALELQPTGDVLVISTANPQPLGIATPGTSGEVSDAGHIHTLPTAAEVGADPAGAAAAAVSALGLGAVTATGATEALARDQISVYSKTETDAAITMTVGGLLYKQPCRAVATTPVASLSGLPTMDGVTVLPTDANKRVLLTAQPDAKKNGPWVTNTGAWLRPDPNELQACAAFPVEDGTVYHDTVWYLTTNDPIVPDATDIALSQLNLNIPASQIIDSSVAGRALLTALAVADQRTSLGLGGAAVLNVGTTAGTVAAGDAPSAAASAAVAAIPSDGSAATPSLRTLGTTATQAAAGNDARLSNARTPTAHASSHATSGDDALTPSDIGAVPTSRQITAGTGLSGGGDLGADRTLAVSYGTTAGTAAQGNDSRITGAVQTSRSITAGTGLTGGGDLSADRTLAVSYGTTLGTAAQGDDSRITGAVQGSTLTTRGDLFVRGASAVGRLALGAAKRVLSSDGTDAVWATIASALADIGDTRGQILRRGASVWEGLAASTANTFLGGDGTDVGVRTAAQVKTSLGLGAVTATGADAATARAAISAEIALDQLAVAGALHHWRLDDAGPNFANSGSQSTVLAYVSGTREYQRAGVYARYGATLQRSPSVTNRCEASVSIASGVDLSIGVTIANEDGTLNTPTGSARIIAMVHDGGNTGSRNGILIVINSSSALYANVATGAASTDTATIAMDWSRPHRVDVTRNGSTGATVVYVDGVARISQTITGTMGALSLVSLGGHGATITGTGGCPLLCTDLTVHTSVLSAATVLSRSDACRRLACG